MEIEGSYKINENENRYILRFTEDDDIDNTEKQIKLYSVLFSSNSANSANTMCFVFLKSELNSYFRKSNDYAKIVTKYTDAYITNNNNPYYYCYINVLDNMSYHGLDKVNKSLFIKLNNINDDENGIYDDADDVDEENKELELVENQLKSSSKDYIKDNNSLNIIDDCINFNDLFYNKLNISSIIVSINEESLDNREEQEKQEKQDNNNNNNKQNQSLLIITELYNSIVEKINEATKNEINNGKNNSKKNNDLNINNIDLNNFCFGEEDFNEKILGLNSNPNTINANKCSNDDLYNIISNQDNKDIIDNIHNIIKLNQEENQENYKSFNTIEQNVFSVYKTNKNTINNKLTNNNKIIPLQNIMPSLIDYNSNKNNDK